MKMILHIELRVSCLIPLQQLKSFRKIEMQEWIQTKHCNVLVLPLKAQYMGTILDRVGTFSSFPTFSPYIGLPCFFFFFNSLSH